MQKYFDIHLSNLIASESKYSVYSDYFPVENLKKYPTHLYKFRDCNQAHNFEMIENEYLWADNPENFLDPSDSLINLKLKSEIPSIQKWLYGHVGELSYLSNRYKNDKPLAEYVEANNAFLDISGRFNSAKFRKLTNEQLDNLPREAREKVKEQFEYLDSPEFEEKAILHITESINRVVNILRKNNLVCCLTQRKENQKMWEEYADKYSGFVIEYNLSNASNIPESAAIISHMFPVSYRKNMPRVPLLPFLENMLNKELFGIDTKVLFVYNLCITILNHQTY